MFVIRRTGRLLAVRGWGDSVLLDPNGRWWSHEEPHHTVFERHAAGLGLGLGLGLEQGQLGRAELTDLFVSVLESSDCSMTEGDVSPRWIRAGIEKLARLYPELAALRPRPTSDHEGQVPCPYCADQGEGSVDFDDRARCYCGGQMSLARAAVVHAFEL